MPFSRIEQETIINFNEEEATAGVYTHNGRLQRRLEQLERDRPAEVSRDHNGDFVIPKGWIKITPPRQYSEAVREKYKDSLQAAYAARNVRTRAGAID